MQSEWYDANIIEIEQKYLIIGNTYERRNKWINVLLSYQLRNGIPRSMPLSLTKRCLGVLGDLVKKKPVSIFLRVCAAVY